MNCNCKSEYEARLAEVLSEMNPTHRGMKVEIDGYFTLDDCIKGVSHWRGDTYLCKEPKTFFLPWEIEDIINKMLANRRVGVDNFNGNDMYWNSGIGERKTKPAIADNSCSTCAKEPNCKLGCYKKEVSDFCSKQYTCDEYSKGAFQKLKELAKKLNFRRIK